MSTLKTPKSRQSTRMMNLPGKVRDRYLLGTYRLVSILSDLQVLEAGCSEKHTTVHHPQGYMPHATCPNVVLELPAFLVFGEIRRRMHWHRVRAPRP